MFVKLREELYEKSWAKIDDRIQVWATRANTFPDVILELNPPECLKRIKQSNVGRGHVLCWRSQGRIVSRLRLPFEMTFADSIFRDDKIPSAFIITGSNIAAQNLLFEQLSETLQQTSQSKFVRLRSSEVTNLKATLKKVIRDVTDAVPEHDEGGLQVASGQDVSVSAFQDAESALTCKGSSPVPGL